MVTRRLVVGGLILTVFFSLLSPLQAEARGRFRSRFLFARPSSQRFISPARFRFNNRQFSRQPRFNSNRFFSPVSPIGSSPFLPISNPGFPGHSDPSLPVNPIPERPSRPIAPELRPSEPSPIPGTANLSEFCDASCPSTDFTPHYCWVPRVGQLTIVPFSFESGNLCTTMRGLCRDIRNSGQDPDSHPFICKDKAEDKVVIRHEPGERGNQPTPTGPKGKLSGDVVRLSGDLMPGPEPLPPGRGEIKKSPLANLTVAVFRGPLSVVRRNDAFGEIIVPRAVNTSGKTAVATATTDENGQFSIDLPPGEYTVVVRLNGEFIHADGAFPKSGETWTTITVGKGEDVKTSIVDNQVTH